MPPITAADFYRNWSNGMNGAQERITRGVQAVTQSPGVQAAASQDKLRANWLRAIDSGKWARAMEQLTLGEWQRAMIQKGIPRIADGVRGAQAKVTNFASQFIPFITNLRQQVQAMPNTTPQDSEARVLAWIRGMREFQYNP